MVCGVAQSEDLNAALPSPPELTSAAYEEGVLQSPLTSTPSQRFQVENPNEITFATAAKYKVLNR